MIPTRLLCAAVLLLAGCAGTGSPQVQGPPRDTDHGSVEEVMEILAAQGVPCRDPEPVALQPGIEQAVECTLSAADSGVLLVHFFDVNGAKAFEEQTRASGASGVYADTWAARTDDVEAAELIAKAVQHRARS